MDQNKTSRRQFLGGLAAILAVSALGSNCRTLSVGPHSTGSEILPGELRKKYGSFSPQIEWHENLEKRQKTEHYTLRRIVIETFPENIEIVYYDSHKPNTPMVFVLPIAGGGYDIEEFFASYFARRGFSAGIVRRNKKFKDIEAIKDINPIFDEIIKNHRRAIDWAGTQPDLDSEKIGVFGISLGGIKASLITPFDKRIKASVIALAGGNLPYILTYSTESGIQEVREDIMRQEDITSLNELEQRLKNELEHDPLKYAKYVDPDKVFMILSRLDSVVPYGTQLALWEAMGKPKAEVLPFGHYTSILCAPGLRPIIFDFFEEKFAEN